MSKDLPLCPFCGKKVKFVSTESDDLDDQDIWDVMCRTKGCYLEFGAGWFYTKEKITKMWSKRS